MSEIRITLETKAFNAEEVEIHRLSGKEVISKLFEFQLELVTVDGTGLDLDEVQGAEVDIVFKRDGDEVRRLHGLIISVVDATEAEQDACTYRVEVRPLAWHTTLVETLDIQLGGDVTDIGGVAVDEIIRRKLSMIELAEGTDFVFRLRHKYPKRNFVVQYRETDLQFISRLAEHWGICFFFEHYKGGERWVFADDAQGHARVGHNADISFRGAGEPMDVFKLELERKLVPAHYVCRDYNYRTPLLNVKGEYRIEGAYAGAIVDYGSHCKTPDEAKLMARVRAEERGATREVYSGRSDQVQFHPGATFELNGHPRYGGEMLLLEVRHEASQTVHGHGDGTEVTYSNNFRAIPASTPFRPPRLTPVPRIHGVVTGVVETGSGLIRRFAKLDDEGRYRVKFLFDTAARGERRASKDVRMLQPSAGENYGVHFPLKPGTEVLITFLDGDPDRPLIVGSVPNPVTPTPVAEKVHSKSRIKSESGVIIEIEDGNRPR